MEKIIFLFPLGSCSSTDMENYFRGSLNRKRYFVFFFSFGSLSLSLSHTQPSFFLPLFRTLSPFLSFSVGRIYSKALRAHSARAIWPLCPFHKEWEVRNPFSMYNTLHTHLNHTRCMLSNRPARLTLLHSVHSQRRSQTRCASLFWIMFCIIHTAGGEFDPP